MKRDKGRKQGNSTGFAMSLEQRDALKLSPRNSGFTTKEH